MPNAKGSGLISLIEILRSSEEAARQALPEELHRYLDPGTLIATHQWYPMGDYLGLLRAAGQVVPAKSGLNTYERMGYTLAKIQLAGDRRGGGGNSASAVYKSLVIDGDPWGGVNRSPKLWKFMYDSGRTEIGRLDEHTSYFDVLEFPTTSPELCSSITGYLRGVYLVYGIKEITVSKARCSCRGDDRCRWELHWNQSITEIREQYRQKLGQ